MDFRLNDARTVDMSLLYAPKNTLIFPHYARHVESHSVYDTGMVTAGLYA